MTSASPQSNICTGKFCDSQIGVNPCARLLADPQKHWCLSFSLVRDEFAEVTRSDVTLVSLRTTLPFPDPQVQDCKLSDTNIDPFALDHTVRTIRLKSFFFNLAKLLRELFSLPLGTSIGISNEPISSRNSCEGMVSPSRH